jgi:acyl-[acyl-carrier-protein]-phospholipid O-acyltransferase/long-chain-fatty-acid--[acyl-carrier-protein] ligase
MKVTDWLRDRMICQLFETEMEFGHGTVPEAIQEAAQRLSGKVVLEDVSLQQVSYRRLFTGAQLLAAEWRKLLSSGARNVGVLLPNVNGMPVTILSLWGAGKTPAILNYSTGPSILLACARLAADWDSQRESADIPTTSELFGQILLGRTRKKKKE